MTIIIPDGFALITYTWQSILFDSGGAATTHGTTTNGLPLPAVAGNWAAAMQEEILPLMTPDVTLVSVTAVTDDLSAEITVGEAGGSSETTMNAPNVAVLVKEVTASRGRRGRGRMFLPGLAFDSQVTSSGLMASGYVDSLQAAIDSFRLSAQTPDGMEMVVLQRTTPTVNPPENPTPPLSPPPEVTDLQVQSKVASQRRRLRR